MLSVGFITSATLQILTLEFFVQTVVCRLVRHAMLEIRHVTRLFQDMTEARRCDCDSTPSTRLPSGPRWHAAIHRRLPAACTDGHTATSLIASTTCSIFTVKLLCNQGIFVIRFQYSDVSTQ